MCILDNSSDHYVVVHPDTLVSGTTVSMATKCLRQSILNERFRTEGQNEAMLIGTLLHDLFDLAMEFNGEHISKIYPPSPLVGKVDSAIHRINHHPADSMVCFVNSHPLDSDLSGG